MNKVIRRSYILWPVLIVTLVAMACGGDDDTATPSPTQTPVVITVAGTTVVVTATPEPRSVRYGELVVAMKEDVPFMLPKSCFLYTHLSPMYDLLFEIDESPIPTRGEFDLKPLLVKTWEFTSDLKILKFDLQEGVKFHNGTEFTAEDIAWLPGEYYQDELTKGAVVAGRWGKNNAAARVVSTHGVEFFRTDGLRFPPEMLTSDTALQACGITSKDYVKSVGFVEAEKNPIGTGPFRFVERSVGRFKYEATRDHFKYDPPIDTITVLQVPESSVRVSLVEVGRAEMADEVEFSDAARARDQGLTLFVDPNSKNVRAVFGGLLSLVPGNAPWVNSRDVRLAMAIAIDRETMSKELRLGLTSPLDTVYVSPNGTHLEGYPYDPQRAKELLAQAGYPNGFSLETPMLFRRGAARIPEESQAIYQYWEAIGLKTSIAPWESDLAFPAWDSNDPEQTDGMAWVMSTTTNPGAPLSEWGRFSEIHLQWYLDAKVLGLADQMKEARGVDETLFNSLEKEAIDYMHDLVGFIPIYSIPEIAVMGENFVRWDHTGYSDQKTLVGLIFEN